MDGREYELTQGLVRARLRGQAPGDIRQYWVEIDGVPWPVKQVLRLATGSSEFQSQTAQRHLRKLGFAVGGDSVPRSGTTGLVGPAFDVAALNALDSVDLRVSFGWRLAGSVHLDASGFPKFPELPRVPGLYRFDFGLDEAGVSTLYVGESENLRKRAGQYRNAKRDGGRNRTSRRIHKEVVAHLGAGGGIKFAIATDVQVDGDAAANLRLKSVRRLAENAAVLLAQTAAAVRVLNIDADLGEDQEGSSDIE